MSEEWVQRELEALRGDGLDRRLTEYAGAGGIIEADGHRLLNFSSNDYLGLTKDERVLRRAGAALAAYGPGSASSRLVTGTLPVHTELENRLARLKGYPAALVFSSGYAANLGTIPALVGRGEHVVADRLCHASIMDASVLSRAKVHRFHHNDPSHLESTLRSIGGARTLVVTESVFSMDGDIAPLSELVRAAKKHGAMVMVDEAHATGVFGCCGAGLVREQGLEGAVDISMGTLSKALASLGGFVACSEAARDLLVNRARSFIYTTALPPSAAGAALGSLEVLASEAGLGKQLRANAAGLRDALRDAGLDTGPSASQVIPLIVGDNCRAINVAKMLAERGIIATAIRPPTVPAGTARLRLSVTLEHSHEDLERAAVEIADVVGRA